MLVAAAKAKAGIGAQSTADLTADKNAPIAPVWTPGYTPGAAALIARAEAGKAFFDPSAKLYSDLGATGDYKSLFALHTGLQTLNALASQAADDTISAATRAQTIAMFSRGMTELQQFFSQQPFEDIRLAQGDRVDAAQTTLALPSKSQDYLTGVIHRGSLTTTVSGLDPNAKFTVTATSAGGTVRNVAIDLSQMGTQTRSLSNVISFVNSKLAAAGAASRLEAVDQTPKSVQTVVAGVVKTSRYTGAKQYALKVDVNAGEKVAFTPVAGDPAFYVVGDGLSGGSRLIKLSDSSGVAGTPTVLQRPVATTDAAAAAGGYAPDAGATEYRTSAMVSLGVNNFEGLLAGAGEATLKLAFADGRTMSVSTAWRSKDLEAWNIPVGQSDERGRLGDLAARLTQLLHEQGVGADVEVWDDGTESGLSIFGDDGVSVSSLQVGNKAAVITTTPPANMTGGLRDGVFARRFEAGAVAAASDLYVGEQVFTFATATGSKTITIEGGANGIDAATLVSQLNTQLKKSGVRAAASLVDDAGAMTFRIDAMHDVTSVGAAINGDSVTSDLVAPGAWAYGGLPVANPGEPFGDAVRDYVVGGGSPLSAYTGAVNLQVVVATATGSKTINVAIGAQERADNPDSGGALAQLFQDRIATALNAAGVYVGASGDLTTWSAAEDAGQRIQSITINGDAQTFGADAMGGLGGAFSEERSFTSASAASATTDDVSALLSNGAVSVTFDTVWGQKTVAASLELGDPPTLGSAALRLNAALSAAGYDVGVEAAANGSGGAGLRFVTGDSHTVRNVTSMALGATDFGVTLDAVDEGAAARASRGAAVTETIPSTTSLGQPSVNTSAWFPGRAFDVAIGGGAKVATTRAVAAGPDGSVYVLADISADAGGLAIKGARDIALFKYDSAGKLAYSEVLGASTSASGFALAVDQSTGNIAIAGSVEGDLSGASAGKGGADSIVTVLDSSGKTLWTQRRGAVGNDQAQALAFAPDGSLIAAGKTDSALGSSLALGGSDAYVRGYSSTGAELFTRQFGASRDDSASALLVRSNGAGGIDIITGGVEDNRGVLRSFSYQAGAGLSTGATRDIGYFYKGEINALAASGAELYVGGAAGADRLTLDSTARGAVAGQEGFVARLDADLTSHALDRATYLGSAQDDTVRGVAVVNGQVYASGVTGGVIAGLGASNVKQGFISRIGDDGAAEWTRTFTSSGGSVTLNAMAVDQSGASPLDILGLPRGVVSVNDSSKLTDRSALRVDDEFKIGVDGRRLTTIKITAADTLASLASSINRVLGSSGRAEIVKDDSGKEALKITARDGKAIRLDAGREGHDALGALGLTQGVIAVNTAGSKSMKTFGLGLIAADLKLDTKANATKAKAEVSAAASIVRQAYEALLHPNAKPQTAEEKALAARKAAAGAAPEYYTAQLQNYKAALARLGGSSS